MAHYTVGVDTVNFLNGDVDGIPCTADEMRMMTAGIWYTVSDIFADSEVIRVLNPDKTFRWDLSGAFYKDMVDRVHVKIGDTLEFIPIPDNVKREMYKVE